MLTPANTAYWTGGERGELLINRCQDCGYYVHPPTGFCPSCEGRRVTPEAVSGRGTVASFTVNHQAWEPGLAVPYVLALIELDEQPDVRLVTNIVGCAAHEVSIGMAVAVSFEQHDDVWLPLFGPPAPA